jgi:hypothetical protein
MKLTKINKIVSYYEKPALGNVNPETRYMALTVDKESKSPYLGLAREITKSRGSVDVPGFVDKSKLIIVKSKDLLSWTKVKDLRVKGIENITRKIKPKDSYFIGLEDPDIYNEGRIKHVYFTIAFKKNNEDKHIVYLGHAQGKSLNQLTATQPALSPILNKNICGFKETDIPLRTSSKILFTLNEIVIFKNNNQISAISLSKANNFSKPWKFKKIILHPKKMKYKWCQGELSPCCFLPKDFLNYDGLLVGIINGREPKKILNKKEVYGKFRPGLILFNTKTGEIPWISKEPLFEDPDARTITFTSDFIQTKSDEGILYAHVNDSFVRAYRINKEELKKYIEKIAI